MNTQDKRIHDLSREALDAATEAQSAAWGRRLDAAREQALAKHTALWQPWRLAAVAAVLVAALSIGILLQPGDDRPPSVPVANADLYQDLEFYLWLAQELESESASDSPS